MYHQHCRQALNTLDKFSGVCGGGYRGPRRLQVCNNEDEEKLPFFRYVTGYVMAGDVHQKKDPDDMVRERERGCPIVQPAPSGLIVRELLCKRWIVDPVFQGRPTAASAHDYG